MFARGLALTGLAIIALAVATGCGASGPEAVTDAEYVSIGDSFTAGVGIKPQATRFVPDGCRQSLINYPHLVAKELAFLAFVDASCGGAKISDIRKSQDTGRGTNPPQIDRVEPETLYVTVSIGGNDANYDSAVKTCFGNNNPNATPCADKFETRSGNELIDSARALEPQLAKAISQIQARAARAKVVVVGYPRLLPPGGRGCKSNVGVSRADAIILNRWLLTINRSLAGAAENTDSSYVDLYEQSEGHDACQPADVRWVEPGSGTNGADPFHPNEAGQQAAARAVARELELLSRERR